MQDYTLEHRDAYLLLEFGLIILWASSEPNILSTINNTNTAYRWRH